MSGCNVGGGIGSRKRPVRRVSGSYLAYMIRLTDHAARLISEKICMQTTCGQRLTSPSSLVVSLLTTPNEHLNDAQVSRVVSGSRERLGKQAPAEQDARKRTMKTGSWR